MDFRINVEINNKNSKQYQYSINSHEYNLRIASELKTQKNYLLSKYIVENIKLHQNRMRIVKDLF
jgi:hypothetical protein